MHQVYEECEYQKLEGDFCVKIKRTDDALHRYCYACIVIIPQLSLSSVGCNYLPPPHPVISLLGGRLGQ